MAKVIYRDPTEEPKNDIVFRDASSSTPTQSWLQQALAMPDNLEAGRKASVDALMGLAPEVMGAAGGIGGGALGGMAGGVGAIPGALAGSGLMYAAGQNVRDLYNQKPDMPIGEQLTDQAMGIGKGMLQELGGQAIGAVTSKALGGAANWTMKKALEQERYRLGQKLVDEGIPLDPSTFAPGRTAKFASWLVNRIEPGRSIAQLYRNRVNDYLLQMRREFIENAGLPPVGSMAPGEGIEKVNQAFAKLRETAPGVKIPIQNTQTFLAELDDAALSPATKEFIDFARDFTKKGELTTPEIERFNSSIWGRQKAGKKSPYERMTPEDREVRQGVLDAIYGDLETNEIAQTYGVLDAMKNAKLTHRQMAQANTIEGLLERATQREGNYFNAYQFYDLVKKNERKLITSLGKETANNVFDFAKQMKVAAGTQAIDRQQMAEPWLMKQASRFGPLGALGGGAAADPGTAGLIALPLMAQGWLAHSLMAPSGWTRKFLTTGFPTLPAPAGLAGRAAIGRSMATEEE